MKPTPKDEELQMVVGDDTEDLCVIVNGECRVVPHGETVFIERRFADELFRALKAMGKERGN